MPNWNRRNLMDQAVKTKVDAYPLSRALEGVFYELKPLLYLGFALFVLRTDLVTQQAVKFPAIFIAAFALYIGLRRLMHRGYLK